MEKSLRGAASQLINNHMLRIFQINDHSELDRIREWSAEAANRTQLIHSEVAGQHQYRVIVETRSYEVDHAQRFTDSFSTAVTETEFPVQHPAPTTTS